MNYTDFIEFERLSKTSKTVPVFLEIEADGETPITLFKKLCKQENCYLLESAEGGEKWGRYSYIGRKPFITIVSNECNITIQKNNESICVTGSVLETVKEILNEYHTAEIDGIPDFVGGAVGYIGYDVIRTYEKLGSIN